MPTPEPVKIATQSSDTFGPYTTHESAWTPESPRGDEPLFQHGNSRYQAGIATYRPWHRVESYVAEGNAVLRPRGRGLGAISGIQFDHSDLVASHRYLPLPSYVRVTNLDSGEEVVVRLVDRGPFHARALLEVSNAVASRLGFRVGLPQPIRIELVQSNSATFSLETNYVYGREAALEIMEVLKTIELGHIQPLVLPHQYENRFRVLLKPFSSLDDARFVADWLNDNHNIQSTIVRE